jgi:hypothetical protein
LDVRFANMVILAAFTDSEDELDEVRLEADLRCSKTTNQMRGSIAGYSAMNCTGLMITCESKKEKETVC